MNELKRLIASVQYQLYANGLLRSLLLGAAAWVVASALTDQVLVQVGVAVVGLAVGVLSTQLYQSKKQEALSLIHQKVKGTEYSLGLLDKEQPNLAEQLQLERLYAQVAAQPAPRVLFTRLWPYGLVLAAAFLLRWGIPYLGSQPAEVRNLTSQMMTSESKQQLPMGVKSMRVYIQPPAYSGLPATETTDLNISALAGSKITWQVDLLNAQGLTLRLADSRNQEVPFREVKGQFEYSDRLMRSGLYTLKAYRGDSLVLQTDFYRLEAQPDLPPKITPASKEFYRYHLLNDPKKVTVAAKISDDFRVQQAFIVATMARGSGENVKFREVRLPLTPSSFKEANLTKVLDLNALQFAPGDELYYYWAAVDNRQPEPNFTKSDTYFIVYRDTTQLEEAELATMAVNRMPEYFRSQRQIIIDTEKLIAKRKKISSKEFNSTSNEIGFDQKVLRLRYGQFMGEEFETDIGGGALPADGDAGSLLEGFMHKHDTEEEHASQVEAPGHDHNHGAVAPNEQQDPLVALMEQYVHSHDDGEVNTFYDQSTRSLLKMALEQMWQSELHLRLYEPEKALPYENKALEYLKSAQQKARTYVKKSGFDPPPLKEKETRLTGKLDKVNDRFEQQRTYEQEQLAAKAGRLLGYLELSTLSSRQKQDVQLAGAQLAERIINSGLKNWEVVGTLQKMAGGKVLSDEEKERLKAFLLPLTRPSRKTNPSYRSEPKLEEAFWHRLL
jgi:hypothetical protein